MTKFYRKSWPRRLWPKEAIKAEQEKRSRSRHARQQWRRMTPEQIRLAELLERFPPHMRSEPEIAAEISHARELCEVIR